MMANGYNYVIQEFPIWVNKSRVARECFNPKGFPKRLKLCFFDIPNINDMSPESDEFIAELANSDNLELFNLTINHIIINNAWNQLWGFFVCFMMIPYTFLLVTYSAW